MSEQPTFTIPPTVQEDATTGRLIVTYQEDSVTSGMASLKKLAGIANLPSAADFENSSTNIEQVDAAGGIVFPTLGIAVVTAGDQKARNNLMVAASEGGAILAIEPERLFYALEDGSLPLSYLRGYRDAVNHLYEAAASAAGEGPGAEAEAVFFDDAQSTWGLKATKVLGSRFTGRGINVAILDTGLDLEHPDFLGRSITSHSFISGEEVQDKNSHDTHCTGTACGRRDNNGRRYGCAADAAIFSGKVLDNGGSGPTTGILAGMEWAITNGCQVISMSLGNKVSTPSTAYEAAGQRALQRGCLIVAAAGNHRQTPPARHRRPAGQQPRNHGGRGRGQPATPGLFLLHLRRSGRGQRRHCGSGVNICSSVPMPQRYDGTFSGTSMATPHVAGIAALWAQARGARGSQLWQLLTSQALRLLLPAADVGAGLVQAPL